MKRRSFLQLGAIGIAMPGLAFAQLPVLALRLVRPADWETLLERNQCVVGDLYITQPNFPLSGTGARKNVQLHIGAKPVSTSGCIVLATDASCSTGGSVEAIRRLRREYGETDTKPVLLRIQA